MKKQLYFNDIQLLAQLLLPALQHLTIEDETDCIIGKNYKQCGPDATEAHRVLILTGKTTRTNFSEFDTVFDFGGNRIHEFGNKRSFNFLCHQDGSMRWLFSKNDFESVRQFYPVFNLRSRLIGGLLKCASMLRIGRLVSNGQLTIHSRQSLQPDQLLSEIPFTHYGIFTGTPGSDRTPVLALRNKFTTTHYVKYGLTHTSCNSINQEGRNLSRLSFMDFETFVIPQHHFLNNSQLLVTTNIRPDKGGRTAQFQSIHAMALSELRKKTSRYERVCDLLYWDHFLTNLKTLKYSEKQGIRGKIVQKLESLKYEVNYDTELLTHTAFGDFTPWNHYTSGNKLFVYDLENLIRQAPFLYDLFHFHFQTGCLTDRKSFRDIYRQCLNSMEHQPLKETIALYNIDPVYYLKMYLLHRISFQLVSWADLASLNEIQTRQLGVWEDALEFVTNSTSKQPKLDFMLELNDVLSRFRHAFIKFDASDFRYLPEHSDLDIAIEKNALQSVINFAANHRNIHNTTLRQLSFMTTITCNFKDGTHLSLDLIHEFKRKNTVFMEIRRFLRSSVRNCHSIRVPDLRYDIEYTLCFYYLNNAEIPDKYQKFFGNYSKYDRSRSVHYINAQYNLELTTWEELFEQRTLITKAIRNQLQQKQVEHPFTTVLQSYNYVKDVLRQAIVYRPVTITISGVDGVGKSTVIEALLKQLPSITRREVVLLRHRPHILPILSSIRYGSVSKAEAAASGKSPGDAKKTGTLSSYLRFAYYFTDYIIGQLYIFFRYKTRGKIVVYDRYYYDFINHPERSNLRISRKLSKWFYRFINKPHVNILLDADAAIIRSRKQELDTEVINELATGYRELFSEFGKKYPKCQFRTIPNYSIDRTTEEILQIVQQVA